MSLAANDLEWVRDLVREHAAVVLEGPGESLAELRLLPVAHAQGFRDTTDLLAWARLRPFGDLHRRIVEAMITNETSFFRDVKPFDALRTVILPEVIAHRAALRSLNIWCAACSTGQEPYSVAMLFREHFAAALEGWAVRIFASDVSEDALSRARAGIYHQLAVNRGLPAPLLVKYFRRNGADWEVAPVIRSLVEFLPANLAAEWPSLPMMDVILLRNVLIYFDLPTKRDVLARAKRQLRPRGFLVVGAAETPITIASDYDPIEPAYPCCYRLRD